ncbi:hypothetical protein MRX96_033750 [Rhipicephalus microplus]
MRHAWLAAVVWLAAALPDQLEENRALLPGVPCDEWDASTGTCFFRRQVYMHMACSAYITPQHMRKHRALQRKLLWSSWPFTRENGTLVVRH